MAVRYICDHLFSSICDYLRNNMKTKCPTCKKKTEWQNNPFRPFCSERCKLIDLGAWASDEYRFEGEKISEESDMEVKND